MFDQINNLLKGARPKTLSDTNGQEPLQTTSTAETRPAAQTISWQPAVNLTTLPDMQERVRQIEASMVRSAQAEFAAVIKQLNASRGSSDEK